MRSVALIAILTLRLLVLSPFFFVALAIWGLIIVTMLALSPEIFGGAAYLGTLGIAKGIKSLPAFTLTIWSLSLLWYYPVYLSSTILPTEILEGTLPLGLSRPVSRTKYLVGKWFGLFLFVTLCFFLSQIGELIFSISVGARPHLSLSTVLHLVQELINPLLLVAVGLALSTVTSARSVMLFVCLWYLLSMVHPQNLLQQTHLLLKLLGFAAMLVFPLASNYSAGSAGLTAGRSLIEGQLLIITENCLFIAVIFLLSAKLFSRRDLRS